MMSITLILSSRRKCYKNAPQKIIGVVQALFLPTYDIKEVIACFTYK